MDQDLKSVVVDQYQSPFKTSVQSYSWKPQTCCNSNDSMIDYNVNSDSTITFSKEHDKVSKKQIN